MVFLTLRYFSQRVSKLFGPVFEYFISQDRFFHKSIGIKSGDVY